MKGNRPGSGKGLAVAAFALGAATGSILALLYAPASGQVTRRRIAGKFRTLQRTATRQIGQRLNGAREWVVAHVTNGHNRRLARQAIAQRSA